MPIRFSAAIALAALTAAMSAVMPTDAEARSRRAYDGVDMVTVDSRHGNGSVSGAVRPGRKGWEVQLPSGSWVGCRRSCEETLRVQTVDLFETDGRMVGYGTFQNQCGIFGCLEIRYPR